MDHIASLFILGLSLAFIGWALVTLGSRRKNKDH
jgi:hypothetical protein